MVRVPLRAVMALIPAFILAALLFLGGNALLRSYTANVTYPAYIESLDLAEGSIGSAPTPDTPQATSIADMESMDTFYMIGAVGWDYPRQIGGQWYYEVEFLSDDLGFNTYTTILARINKDASERLESGGRRLPIGRWLPLDTEGAELHSVDIKDHYVDMLGDHGLVMTEGEFHGQQAAPSILSKCVAVVMLVLWALFASFFTRKGWF